MRQKKGVSWCAESMVCCKTIDAHLTQVLLSSKKWRLQKEGRQSRRQGVEKKSDWLSDKPRSNYWLRVAASNLSSQSPCLAGVTQSHCNPQ